MCRRLRRDAGASWDGANINGAPISSVKEKSGSYGGQGRVDQRQQHEAANIGAMLKLATLGLAINTLSG